jgi:hypothetical protein
MDAAYVTICDVATRDKFELSQAEAERWAELELDLLLDCDSSDPALPDPYDEWGEAAEALWDAGSAQTMDWRELHSPAIFAPRRVLLAPRRCVTVRRGTTRAIRPIRRARVSRSRAPTAGDSDPSRDSRLVPGAYA